MTSKKDLRAMVKLNLTGEVGPVMFQRLVEYFGSAENALNADKQELRMVEGIGEIRAARISATIPDETVDREFELAEERGVRIMSFTDPDYPANLQALPDPPIILYVRGELKKSDVLSIAIVGTRRCTFYGKKQAERFGEALARRGFTVVSGLAYGIDSHAHRGTLRAKGRTIAVIPNGLCSIYPPEHEKLADEIAENGALVTEFPMLMQVQRENFPRRNRIISGMSLGTLVIEAPRNSGALITARWASEQNREVFAIPGQIDNSQSFGPHRLIKEGAKLTESIEDILEELGPLPQPTEIENSKGEEVVIETPKQMGLNERESKILMLLSTGTPKHIDEIIRESGLPAGSVSSALMVMELKKCVTQLSGKRFVRN